jgi:hypothetical protein
MHGKSPQTPWDCYNIPDCTDGTDQWYKYENVGGMVLFKPGDLINSKGWEREADAADLEAADYDPGRNTFMVRPSQSPHSENTSLMTSSRPAVPHLLLLLPLVEGTSA